MGVIVSVSRGAGDGEALPGELWERFLRYEEQLGILAATGIIGYRPEAELPQGDNVVNCVLQIPLEFQSLISVQGIFVCQDTGNLNWSAATNYGHICTENHANHAEMLLNQDTAFVANLLNCVDLAGVFTGIAALDNIGLQFVRNAAGSTIDGSIYAIGVRLRYDV